MPKQRFTAEEIIHKLREADVLIGQGKTIADTCKVPASRMIAATGKTTFASEYLARDAGSIHFINADLWAVYENSVVKPILLGRSP